MGGLAVLGDRFPREVFVVQVPDTSGSRRHGGRVLPPLTHPASPRRLTPGAPGDHLRAP